MAIPIRIAAHLANRSMPTMQSKFAGRAAILPTH